MFESIINFFKNIGKTQKENLKSKDAAKERLQLVLMQDRANVSADYLDLMKQEIIEVIKKYIDVDENAIDVRLTNTENGDGTIGAPALYANIPIVSVKENVKNVNTVKKVQDSKNEKDDKEKQKEQKPKEEKTKEKETKEKETKEVKDLESKENNKKEDKQEKDKNDDKKDNSNPEIKEKENANSNEKQKEDKSKKQESKKDENKEKEVKNKS